MMKINEVDIGNNKNHMDSCCGHQQEVKKHPFLKKDSSRRIPINLSSSKTKLNYKNLSIHQSGANSSQQKPQQDKQNKNKKQLLKDDHKIQIAKKQNKGKENQTINKLTFGNYDHINQQKGSFFTKQDFQLCPSLYFLWRTEKFVNEIQGNNFTLRNFSKGRKEIRYKDGTLQAMYEDIKLTRWINGDFKLMEGEKISFWSEELEELDSYYTN